MESLNNSTVLLEDSVDLLSGEESGLGDTLLISQVNTDL